MIVQARFAFTLSNTTINVSDATIEVNNNSVFFAQATLSDFLGQFLLYVCQRVLAYTLRYISNLYKTVKGQLKVTEKTLSSSELQNALNVLVKHTQLTHFAEDLPSKKIPKPLRKLDVFVDENNLLRVGGRLRLSSLSYNAKYPQKSHLTRLIIN